LLQGSGSGEVGAARSLCTDAASPPMLEAATRIPARVCAGNSQYLWDKRLSRRVVAGAVELKCDAPPDNALTFHMVVGRNLSS